MQRCASTLQFFNFINFFFNSCRSPVSELIREFFLWSVDQVKLKNTAFVNVLSAIFGETRAGAAVKYLFVPEERARLMVVRDWL